MFRSEQFNSVGLTVFLFCLLGGLGAMNLTDRPLYAVAGGLVGVYFFFAIKIVDQWQKVAVLRFGRYHGLRGPGLILIIPIVETLSRYVDQRVRVTTVSAESTLTHDTVPVNVDAIIFWIVWNAEKSILEVEDCLPIIGLERMGSSFGDNGEETAAPQKGAYR
jgi:regulator of protease activity HflC (stomatin/prohibitin superfamily)